MGAAKVFMPQAQGASVVQAEVFHVQQVHVGVAADDLQHVLYTGQRATREDVALDKVDAAFGLLKALFTNGDGLQQHQAVGLEQLGTLFEIGGQETMAHRFNHFDRHQLVVLTGEVAVIAQQHGHLILQAQRLDTLGGVGELLLGQGRGGDPTTIMLRRIQRHAAPAGTDFQQMVAGLERQFLADAR